MMSRGRGRDEYRDGFAVMVAVLFFLFYLLFFYDFLLVVVFYYFYCYMRSVYLIEGSHVEGTSLVLSSVGRRRYDSG